MGPQNLYDDLASTGWKRLTEWTAPTDPRVEDQWLEFKAPYSGGQAGVLTPQMKAMLARAVCGMANAEGGVIVVGIRTEHPVEGGEDHAAGVSLVRGLAGFHVAVAKTLPDLTIPSNPKLRCLPIPAPEEPDSGAVAILVSETDSGPFRTAPDVGYVSDKKKTVVQGGQFYLRVGAHTGLMPYSILATMFGKRPSPRLRLRLLLRRKPGPTSEFEVAVYLINSGKGPAERMAAQFELPQQGEYITFPNGSATQEWELTGFKDVGGDGVLIFTSTNERILFPSMMIQLGTGRVMFDSGPAPPEVSHTIRIKARLYALNAPPVDIDERHLTLTTNEPVLLPRE